MLKNQCSISFIERLTYEQVKTFLDELYPSIDGYNYSFRVLKNCDTDENCVLVIVYNYFSHSSFNLTLREYSSDVSRPHQWLNHLSNIFGFEYNRAFLKYGCSISDED